jgi:hypothetical protein
MVATNKLNPTMYPSPSTAVVGKSCTVLTDPRIVIVPGFTPPIVLPDGNEMLSPCDEIAASPRKIVFGLMYAFFTYKDRKRNPGCPRSISLSVVGTML